MSSTNVVNFSLRLNKSIERSLVFECLVLLINQLNLSNLVYVGLGSVWFTDFILAHRLLGIDTMISMEHDEVIFKRAEFNRPYRTLEILLGESAALFPDLLAREDLAGRPWVVWLDHDEEIDEGKLDELIQLMRSLPQNSVVICTFSALGAKYGEVKDRPARISDIFGFQDREPPSRSQTKEGNSLARILATETERYLVSQAIESGRPGSFIPAINLIYRDTSPMVTVGGVLPAPDREEAVKALVSSPSWPGRIDSMIQTAPLTPKEVLALQSWLPANKPLTRADVSKMGFDLHDDQIQAFVDHYLRYPQFMQVAQ
jgi:hypothetical protein